MSADVKQLIADIQVGFAAAGDPEIAAQQQAYMKSSIPYYGIKSPEVRAILKPLLVSHTLRSREEWEHAIRTLWDNVSYREEWYAALAIARYGRYRDLRSSLDSLPLYDHLIRTGAWWDVCDELAQHLVGEVLMQHPQEASAVMRNWSKDESMWIRRCSILSQGKHKEKTDPVLLRDCILPSIDDTDFFSRKAIGWALRDYAKFDPDWVRAFVTKFDDRLSGLTKREALKHIGYSIS